VSVCPAAPVVVNVTDVTPAGTVHVWSDAPDGENVTDVGVAARAGVVAMSNAGSASAVAARSAGVTLRMNRPWGWAEGGIARCSFDEVIERVLPRTWRGRRSYGPETRLSVQSEL
jgi:hypothetical protein